MGTAMNKKFNKFNRRGSSISSSTSSINARSSDFQVTKWLSDDDDRAPDYGYYVRHVLEVARFTGYNVPTPLKLAK